MTFNRRPPVPTRAPPQESRPKTGESAWSDLNRRSPVPETGGIPGFPTHRKLPNIDKQKSTRRELNPHLRRGIAVRCRYITGAQGRTELSKIITRATEHWVRLELTLPHYGCGVVAAGPPVHSYSDLFQQWDQKDLNLHFPG